MTGYAKAFQYTDEFKTEQQARDALDFLATQVDYLNGHILPPNNMRGWFLQTFFEDHETNDMPLPDGVRRVLCPNRMLLPNPPTQQ